MLLVYFFQVLVSHLGASSLEEKKQHFRITVLNTAGDPQQGIILRVAGYSNEYISDEQGLIDFEQSMDNNYTRTANFYLPTDKNKSIKYLRLDEAAQDTIIRIDRPEDLIKFKQTGKTFLQKVSYWREEDQLYMQKSAYREQEDIRSRISKENSASKQTTAT